MDYSIAQSRLNEGIVKKHSLAIVIVCTLFSVLNFARGNLAVALICFGFGILIALLVLLLMKSKTVVIRGAILTQATCLLWKV